MKNLNKILIIFILFSCFSISSVFADPNKSDCGTFAIHPYKQEWKDTNWFDIVNDVWEVNNNENTNFLTIAQQQAIITKDDLNTAILNLKKYCCDRWLTQDNTTCETDRIYFNDNALDSAFLFNHLFDVIMRRLSWLNWDTDIYKKTKMTTDKKWSERRERINTQAESTKWSTPQSISTQYNIFRTQTKWYDISSSIDSNLTRDKKTFSDFVSWKWTGSSTTVSKALKEYENRTLYDRYKNSCALTNFFYMLLGWDQSSDKKKITEASNRCNEFIENQISWENKYVQLITKRSANHFLSNYIQWYMSYMFERQMKLQKLRKDSTDRFLDVVREVPCLQNKCVQ